MGEILRAQLASDGHVGAICAAPMVLATHGIQVRLEVEILSRHSSHYVPLDRVIDCVK